MKNEMVFLAAIFFLVVSPLPSKAYEETTVTNGGAIKGLVRMQGKAPKLPPVDVFKYKDICKAVPNESLVIGFDNGVRYAVVTIEGIMRGKAGEREAVHELDNIRCRFIPHVQAASVGQFLLLKNSDPILHTAHAHFSGGQPQFNVGLYPGRVSRKPLISPGVVKILCEVHPWMTAYVVVTEHPYHSVTDVYGEYMIGDIPAGNYRLKVWHETLGTQEKEVRVQAGETLQVDFAFPTFKGAKK